VSRPPSGARGLGLGVKQRGQPDGSGRRERLHVSRERTESRERWRLADRGGGGSSSRSGTAALGCSRVATCAGVRLCVTAGCGLAAACGSRGDGEAMWSARCLATG